MTTPALALNDADTYELIAILEKTLGAQQQLLSILQKEKSLIIDGKTDPLVNCAGEKEEVLKRLAELETERLQLIQAISSKDSPLTLKSLIPRVSPHFREKLETLRSHLGVITSSIAELNAMNGILVERVLGQISELFAVLQHITSNGETYQSTGEMQVLSPGRTISRG